LNDWIENHKLLRPISIMQSDRIKTPIAVGIIKPRIILPKSMNMDDKQLLSYVLAHEYYHIKRYDAVWKLLSAFVLCIHWFNPMVCVMFVLVNRDLELTCDERVIRHFGTKIKTAYAYSLIDMEEKQKKFTPLYNGFSKNAAEERIVSIMKIKRHSVLTIVIAALLVAGATTAFAAATASTAEQEQGEKFDLRTKERVDVETSADDSAPVALDKSGGVIADNDIGNLKRDDGSGEEVTIEEQEQSIPVDMPEHIEYGVDTDNDIIFTAMGEEILISVKHSDECKFTGQEWVDILSQIEKGKVYWED
jgi:hypothetical protein